MKILTALLIAILAILANVSVVKSPFYHEDDVQVAELTGIEQKEERDSVLR